MNTHSKRVIVRVDNIVGNGSLRQARVLPCHTAWVHRGLRSAVCILISLCRTIKAREAVVINVLVAFEGVVHVGTRQCIPNLRAVCESFDMILLV